MAANPQALSDPQRLQALHATCLLDTPAEEAFDRLTSLSARVVQAPIAMVSLLDRERHYIKSAHGLPTAGAQELPFSYSICRHVVESSSPLIVPDARESSLLRDNPAIQALGVIAYLGIPLATGDGWILGSFCVIDRSPRCWLAEEVSVVSDLAAATMSEISLRCERDLARKARTELEGARAAEQARTSECQRLLAELQQRQRDEAVARAKAAAFERSNADLEHFAYLASHDLQEPLRMITGFLNLIQRRTTALDAQTLAWVASANEGALRMQRLIRDLLAYARVDAVPHDGLVCDSDAALDEAVHILATKLTLAQARIEREPLPPVMCNHSQLMQVFQNLIGNAVKYRSHDPPRIHVGASVAAGSVEFAVADNGIGIQAEQAPEVFELFHRLPNAVPLRGAGLGLAICKRIVERHGGRIWVEPRPGGGSLFRFTLTGADPG